MELHFFLEQLDGQRRELVPPVSFSLVRSADTPADSLKAEFMVPDAQEWEQEIARIELQAEGKRLFRGICDRQIVEVSGAGCRLTVWARSDAAVLLDNEAIPQEYSCVTLDEMFAKHLAPYGFQSDLEGEGSLLGYQIGKGVSEWEAFSTFCQRVLGRSPHVHLSRVSFRLPGRARRTISNGQAVSAVSRTVRRSEVISQVLLRDELLTADGGRVRTNFIITSGAQEEARLAVYDAHKDELSREIVRQLMAHEQEIRAIGFIGCDVPMPRLLWWLIYRCTAALPNPAEIPPRPYHADGGAYHLMGFAREPENRHYLAWDYNGPMYNDGFRWFGLQHFGNSPVQDLFEPNQPHMGKLCALLIRLIQADFDPSCVTADEQELLAELLARGFLRKADGSIKPNFCVLTREQVQRLRQEVFLPIVEAVQPAWTRVCNELRTLCKASVPKHLQALADLPLHMAALAAGYMTEQIAYAYGALEKPETPEDAAMWTLVYEPEIKVTPHK